VVAVPFQAVPVSVVWAAGRRPRAARPSSAR
jgi:hypothetical protein